MIHAMHLPAMLLTILLTAMASFVHAGDPTSAVGAVVGEDDMSRENRAAPFGGVNVGNTAATLVTKDGMRANAVNVKSTTPVELCQIPSTPSDILEERGYESDVVVLSGPTGTIADAEGTGTTYSYSVALSRPLECDLRVEWEAFVISRVSVPTGGPGSLQRASVWDVDFDPSSSEPFNLRAPRPGLVGSRPRRGQVLFSAGESAPQTLLQFGIVDDNWAETSETFEFWVSFQTYDMVWSYIVTAAHVHVQIAPSDPIELEVVEIIAPTEGQEAVYEVRVTNEVFPSTDINVALSYAPAGDPPADIADDLGAVVHGNPVPLPARATIPTGQSSVQVKIPVRVDKESDPGEGFSVIISNPVGGGYSTAPRVRTGGNSVESIIRELPTVTLHSSPMEYNFNFSNEELYVTLSEPLERDLEVFWKVHTVSPDAAGPHDASPSDFISPHGSVVFAAGTATRQTLQLEFVNDVDLYEVAEAFEVRLSLDRNATSLADADVMITRAGATAWIPRDQGGLSLSSHEVVAPIEGHEAVYRVSFSNYQSASFDISVVPRVLPVESRISAHGEVIPPANLNADLGRNVTGDYIPWPNTIVIPAGQSSAEFRIWVTDDDELDAGEAFQIEFGIRPTGLYNSVNRFWPIISEHVDFNDQRPKLFPTHNEWYFNDGRALRFATNDFWPHYGWKHTVDSSIIRESPVVLVTGPVTPVAEGESAEFKVTLSEPLNCPFRIRWFVIDEQWVTHHTRRGYFWNSVDFVVRSPDFANDTNEYDFIASEGYSVPFVHRSIAYRPHGRVLFRANETTQKFQIATADDHWAEVEERFTVKFLRYSERGDDCPTNVQTSIRGTPSIAFATDSAVASIAANDALELELVETRAPVEATEAIYTIRVTNGYTPTTTITVDVDFTATGSSAADMKSDLGTNPDGVPIPLPTTVQLFPNMTSRKIHFWVTHDDVSDAGETFTVTISNPRGGHMTSFRPGGASVTSEIAEVPLVTIAGPVGQLAEGDRATFTVTLSEPLDRALTVYWRPTRRSDLDLLGSPRNITFPANNSASQTFQVAIVDDRIAEMDETFAIALCLLPFDGRSGLCTDDHSGRVTDVAVAPASAVAVIGASDPLELELVEIVPPVEGREAVYEVRVANGIMPTAAITVDIAYAPTGISPADMAADIGTNRSNDSVPPPTKVTGFGSLWSDQRQDAVANGRRVVGAEFHVWVTDDRLSDPGESFAVTISNPRGGGYSHAPTVRVGGGRVESTIREVPVVSIDGPLTIKEGGSAIFRINRIGAMGVPVTLDWAVLIPESPAADEAGIEDFAGTTSGSVTLFASRDDAVQSIIVDIHEDNFAEANENFSVVLTVGASANVVGQSAVEIVSALATSTIEDNDLIELILYGVVPPNEGAEAVYEVQVIDFGLLEELITTADITVDIVITPWSVEWWQRFGDQSPPPDVSPADVNLDLGMDPDGNAVAVPTTVTIPAGESAAQFRIWVTDDAVLDANEGFVVTISNPRSNLDADVRLGTIWNRIMDVPSFAISGPTTSVAEGDVAEFTISVAEPLDQSQIVYWRVAGANPFSVGSNEADWDDFTDSVPNPYTSRIWDRYQSIGPPAGSVTFDPDTTTRTVRVAIKVDGLQEGNESFWVEIGFDDGFDVYSRSRHGRGLITNALAVATIEPVGVTITLDPTEMSEYDTATEVTVTATLTGPVGVNDEGVVVTPSFAGMAGSDDYVRSDTATITIPAGSTSAEATITITPIADALVEGSETIELGGTAEWATSAFPILVTSAQMILTDASTVTVEFAPKDVEVAEGEMATITATFGGPVLTAIDIGWGASPDVEGTSFTIPPGTITAGALSTTITVPILNDLLAEGVEIINLTLTSSVTGADEYTAADQSINVASSDDIIVTVTGPSSGMQLEGTAVDYTVTLSGGTRTMDVTASINIGSGGTGDITDIVLPTPAGITITPMETVAIITVTMVDDGFDAAEVGETIVLMVTGVEAGGAVVIPGSTNPIMVIQPVAPEAPADIMVISGIDHMKVVWTPPERVSRPAITGYQLQVSGTDRFDDWQDIELPDSDLDTTYVHPLLPVKHTLHYRVAAINDVGTGPFSPMVTATTLDYPTDLNNDRHMDANDAAILYHLLRTYTLSIAGNARGRQNDMVQKMLKEWTEKMDNGHGFMDELLAVSAAMNRNGAGSEIDLNDDDQVGIGDAMIMYYTLAFPELVGDGSPDAGFTEIRRRVFGRLVPNVADADYRRLIQRVHAFSVRQVAIGAANTVTGWPQ